MPKLRILLVQLGANGDCILVTTIAKQIKEYDYINSHLTWMVAAPYKSTLLNNPHIDDIIEVPIVSDLTITRNNIPAFIRDYSKQKFDKIFITDYTTDTYKNWYGTTRSSLFRSYPHPLKVKPEPVVVLSNSEIENVTEFIKENNINNATYNILFECSPNSGQSLINFERAFTIAQTIVSQSKKIKIILSSPNKFNTDSSNIIDASSLSFRENAELINYCDLLVGCSSGISWICTSSWSKNTKKIQIIDPNYQNGKFSASMKNDFEFFGISTKEIIELCNPIDTILTDCILLANTKFSLAKRKYDKHNTAIFNNRKYLMESKLSIFHKIYYILKQHRYTTLILFKLVKR